MQDKTNRENQIDPEMVIERLNGRDAPDSSLADPTAMSLTELADHIEETHHAYLRGAMPHLGSLFEKVVRVHGNEHPWLVNAQDIFRGMSRELQAHMMKEEQILFPMIRRIEAGDLTAALHGGGLENPIRVMMIEHDNAGDALKKLRELSGDYQVPPDACNSFRELVVGLLAFERDMHQHVHKENNVLFPRSLRAGSPRGVSP